MQERTALVLKDAGNSGAPEKSILSLRAAIQAYQGALQIYTKDALLFDIDHSLAEL
jgi:hypothetical protein